MGIMWDILFNGHSAVCVLTMANGRVFETFSAVPYSDHWQFSYVVRWSEWLEASGCSSGRSCQADLPRNRQRKWSHDSWEVP